MSGITEIKTKNAPAPLPVFSQAIKANGFVFVSGNIGFEKDTMTLAEGGIKAQTVNEPFINASHPSKPNSTFLWKKHILTN
jgi:hypothetical protein